MESSPSQLGPLTSSCFYCFFRISCNGICLLPHTNPCEASLLPLFLFTKIHFSFGLGLSSSQSFPFLHQTAKTGRVLQNCRHLHSLLPALHLTCAIIPPSIIGSFFCYLICFLIVFSDESFEQRHLLHFLLGAMRFCVLDLQQQAFLMNPVWARKLPETPQKKIDKEKCYKKSCTN